MSTLKVGTIQDHANSNTAMTLDGSGVGLKTSPSFLLQQSGQTTYGSGTYNEIIKTGLHTKLHDTDNAVSSAGLFTVPSGKGGIYIFSWGATILSLGNNYVASSLKIDGSTDSTTESYFAYIGLANRPFKITQMVQLNAGQTVIPQALQASGNTLSDQGNSGRKGFFGGVRIS